ncbi:MAG: peptidylprolyl isomerase [Gemmatimonadota bacterium]
MALVAALVLVAQAAGQEPQGPGAVAFGDTDLVDRIAAVAGDSIILLTEIEEQLLRMQASGMEIPDDEAAMRQLRLEVLESLISQQLLLQAAAQDTMIDAVPADQLDRLVEQNLEERTRSFGSQEALQSALAAQGQTLTSYRASIADDLRRQYLMSQYFERKRRTMRVPAASEAEIREFYEAQRHLLERRPATVTFRQVLVQPQPSDSARAAARAEAERVLGLLRAGEDFETLARRLSQDPGSRAEGGDLGWFRRGTMVDEFEDVAFAMPPGATSNVVETQFGAHIIKVDRVRGSERKVRHILFTAEVGEADLDRARATADEIRRRLEAGESMRALRRDFPTPSQTMPDSLDVPLDQLGNLPPQYGALRDASEGDILGPLVIGPQGRQIVAVARVDEVRQEGDFTFEDLRGQIEERLRSVKLEERVIRELRERAYVDIRID